MLRGIALYKEERTREELVSLLNTPERLERIDNFTVRFAMPNSETIGVHCSEEIVAEFDTLSQINMLIDKSTDEFIAKVGHLKGSKLANKFLEDIIEKKMKQLMIQCFILFADEKDEPDFAIHDKEFLQVGEDHINSVKFQYD